MHVAVPLATPDCRAGGGATLAGAQNPALLLHHLLRVSCCLNRRRLYRRSHCRRRRCHRCCCAWRLCCGPGLVASAGMAQHTRIPAPGTVVPGVARRAHISPPARLPARPVLACVPAPLCSIGFDPTAAKFWYFFLLNYLVCLMFVCFGEPPDRCRPPAPRRPRSLPACLPGPALAAARAPVSPARPAPPRAAPPRPDSRPVRVFRARHAVGARHAKPAAGQRRHRLLLHPVQPVLWVPEGAWALPGTLLNLLCGCPKVAGLPACSCLACRGACLPAWAGLHRRASSRQRAACSPARALPASSPARRPSPRSRPAGCG